MAALITRFQQRMLFWNNFLQMLTYVLERYWKQYQLQIAINYIVRQLTLVSQVLDKIVSGLAPYYTAQELLGRKVLVLCNLKKAKLAGVDSFGMILCAEDSQRNVVELIEPSPGSEILNGARVTLLDSEEEKMASLHQQIK